MPRYNKSFCDCGAAWEDHHDRTDSGLPVCPDFDFGTMGPPPRPKRQDDEEYDG